MEKIFVASDHAGVSLKKGILALVKEKKMIGEDLGPFVEDSVNYPEYAQRLVQSLKNSSGSRGILICGSGIGMSMVANRYQGMRAALCKSIEEAQLSRQHNNANILCLGARTLSESLNLEIVTTWLTTVFAGDRHQKRIDLFDHLGA